MTKQKNRFSLLVILLTFYSLVFSPKLSATEIIVGGNGSESSNEVSIQQDSQTQVSKTNEAEVQNSIQVDASTGGNTASGNTGSDVNIETGDVNLQVEVSNNVNSSVVNSTACCTSNGTNALVEGNGSDSNNKISLNNSDNTYVRVNQTASITNSISGQINTGNNIANDNTEGSVSIVTGSINAKSVINNGPINLSDVSFGGGIGGVSAKISGNGSESDNQITVKFDNDSDVFVNHSSNLENFLVWDLNTGNNVASGNTDGIVSIKTGDINLETFINNFINLSKVNIEGCCDEDIFDPGEDDDDTEDEEDDESDDEEEGVGGISDSSDDDGFLPAGAEAGAGGPGILGLSDTSGGNAQALLFFLGLAFFAFGGKIVTDEIFPSISKK